MEKLPPIEKVYEAYSAIADGRVSLSEGSAAIKSSDGAKEYAVTWEGDVYASNDNATYWQGYAGYPVIAVLMLQDRLPLDNGLAHMFAGVNWTALNNKYKRDYAAAVAEVFAEKHIEPGVAGSEAQKVMDGISALDITLKRGRARKA